MQPKQFCGSVSGELFDYNWKNCDGTKNLQMKQTDNKGGFKEENKQIVWGIFMHQSYQSHFFSISKHCLGQGSDTQHPVFKVPLHC